MIDITTVRCGHCHRQIRMSATNAATILCYCGNAEIHCPCGLSSCMSCSDCECEQFNCDTCNDRLDSIILG